MGNVKTEIDTLRKSIEELTDDSKLSDKYLYEIWIKARARVLENAINSGTTLSDWNKQRFIIELEKTNENIDCIPSKCSVLKSKKPLPEPINNKSGSFFKMYTLSGKLIGRTQRYKIESDSLDDIKNSSARFLIINNHVYIYNSSNPLFYMVEGIWADPLQWLNNTYCDELWEETKCNDWSDIDTGLTKKFSEQTLKLSIELLRTVLGLPDDNVQDYNPEIR